MSGSKKCSKCKKKLSVSQFNRRAASKDGLRASCKKCDADTRASWEKKQVATGPAPPDSSTGGDVGGKVSVENPSGDLPAPGSKVIGRIGSKDRIQEIPPDSADEEERKAQQEYADLLNQKLPIRKRAALLVQIAKRVDGNQAALALQAIRDINLATKVVSKSGAQVDLGPLFVVPDSAEIKVN